MGIRDWFRARAADDREVREEIVFHLDRATQENVAKGMSPEEARAEALRRFGDLEQVRRDCMEARGRGMPRPVAWAAVAALAAASFVGGYAVRSAPPAGHSTVYVQGGVTRAMPLQTLLVGHRNGNVVTLETGAIHPLRVTSTLPLWRGRATSPFKKWIWKDGTPEVSLDGSTWFEIVSVSGSPASTLAGEGKDPYDAILDARPEPVEILLRSLKDGSETKYEFVGGRLHLRAVEVPEKR